MGIIEMFCDFDDFCDKAEKEYEMQHPGERLDPWPSELSLSEVMTICCWFHRMPGFRNFKQFYIIYVLGNMRSDFPNLVSYTRFVELMKLAAIPLVFFLQERKGICTGIAFVDSTKIVVCHNIKNKLSQCFQVDSQERKKQYGLVLWI